MGMYLNSISPYRKYQAVVTDTYFVDKTALIEELLPGDISALQGRAVSEKQSWQIWQRLFSERELTAAIYFRN